METWFANNWWLICPLIAVGVYIAYEVHRQGDERPVSSRLVSLFVPTSQQLASKAIWIVVLLALWIVFALIKA